MERYNQEFQILKFEHAVSPDALISFDSYDVIVVSSVNTSKQYSTAIEENGSHIHDNYGSSFFENEIQEACQKLVDNYFEKATVMCDVVHGRTDKIWTKDDKWTDFMKERNRLLEFLLR